MDGLWHGRVCEGWGGWGVSDGGGHRLLYDIGKDAEWVPARVAGHT